MFLRLPFYIANFLAGFVSTQSKRHVLRGHINAFFYTPMMMRIVKRIYGEKTKTVKFVRQHTPSRVVCVVNDKYFIKIFKHNLGKRLKNFEFLVNYAHDHMNVNIPRVHALENNHGYVTELIDGRDIYGFDSQFVLKNEEKILQQVVKIIAQGQSIDVHKFLNPERFSVALESPGKNTKAEPITSDSVLLHGDLNLRNFLFDDDLNIVGLIDFDGMRITNDKDKDIQNFMKYWNRYKENAKKQTPLK